MQVATKALYMLRQQLGVRTCGKAGCGKKARQKQLLLHASHSETAGEQALDKLYYGQVVQQRIVCCPVSIAFYLHQ